MRVVNTPARGIGKTTMETVERVALETNRSLWGALQQVVEQRLLPARATAALTGFRDLIAMPAPWCAADSPSAWMPPPPAGGIRRAASAASSRRRR